MGKSFLNTILKKIFELLPNKNNDIGTPNKILIVRQHNQLGDLLATVSFFKAIKEKFPISKITLIVSPENFAAITKNKFVDSYFIFNKRKLYNPVYFFKFAKLLRTKYDLAIVPVTVSISFTSNFLARISNSKSRIGIEELSGKKNDYNFFFDRRVAMDWRKHPDANVADFCLDMIRPFGITTSNLKSEISFEESDNKNAEKFISLLERKGDELLIGFHIGAGKPPNRWSLDKFAELLNKLNKNYKAKFYITGSNADKNEIDYLQRKINIPVKLFLNKQIPEVAAIISISNLFITNDTGIMHVAGTTNTSQISIFGPTNPFNWAPIGRNKYFLRKSDLIDDVTVEDVFVLCKEILHPKKVSGEYILAIIDCGSNSFHLVIAKVSDNGSFQIVKHEREVVRIGGGSGASKIISTEVIQRAITTLKKFSIIALSFDAQIRAVATSSIREAQNQIEFLQKVVKETGIEINVIDGIEEARLIFLGIQKAIPTLNQKILCIDIGGGSTEFIIGLNEKILFSSSVKLGAVRLSKMFFPDFIITEEGIKSCLNHIQEIISPVVKEIQEIGFEKCIGTSGTIMSLAFMIKAMKGETLIESYTVNNYTFSKDEFEKIEQSILDKTTAEQRGKIPGIDIERADIIPAGGVILSSLINQLSIDEITVSGFAIREGIILDAIAANS
ncbi:MAG: hypothetical protein NTX22_14295 [Ignavibacteriales bacterium]|nr:hypothetical protein [Ignavibacteriales bacterium]